VQVAQDSPSSYRNTYALEVLRANVSKIEEIAEELSRTFSENNSVCRIALGGARVKP
jgi:hypothetical protein